VGCRYNLYLETDTNNGSIKYRFPDLEPDEMSADRSCVLDVADRGGASLQETGDALNMVRERVRQIQCTAFGKLAGNAPELRDMLEADHGPVPGAPSPSVAALAEPSTQVPSRPSIEPAPSIVADSEPELRLHEHEDVDGRDEANAVDASPAVPEVTVTGAHVEATASPDRAPQDERGPCMCTAANGTTDAPAYAEQTSEPVAPTTTDLVGDFERARAALGERRRALLADVAAIDAAFAGSTDPGSPSDGGASSAPGAAKRPGRPPSPTSRASRVLAYIREHPGATTAVVAQALGRESGEVAGALFELCRSGRVDAAGRRPNTMWTASAPT
jgi:hypothetical protein